MTCLACGQPLTRVAPIAVHPACEVDVDVAVTDVFTVLADGITNQPRSLQEAIGPSEIGHPCARRLGYKLAGTPKVRGGDVAWKPFVGTALHALIGDMFAAHELAQWTGDYHDQDRLQRWWVEERVIVGDVEDDTIDGSVDLFDAWTGIVYDWKFTSRNMLREKYRPHGPGRQYRTQAHAYGRGWARRGFAVTNVAVIFMTRDGEFTDRYVWSEPYDEQVAIDGLKRVENIKAAVTVLGDEAFAMLPAVESFCGTCPWFRSKSPDVRVACPGVPSDVDPFDEMFPTPKDSRGSGPRDATSAVSAEKSAS